MNNKTIILRIIYDVKNSKDLADVICNIIITPQNHGQLSLLITTLFQCFLQRKS